MTNIDYRALLWITVPALLLLAGYFTRKWYRARRLRLHGIGKGAPGFQTSVAQISVTPEIAARLRRGERVSPEEIAAAAASADEKRKREEIVENNEKSTDSETVKEGAAEGKRRRKTRTRRK